MSTPIPPRAPDDDQSQAGSVAALGAGALGLTLAYRLAQGGRAVTVFEREPGAGGLAAGFMPAPGIWLEKFYRHLFRSDRHFTRLLKELGLLDRLVWHRPITASWVTGKAWRLDSLLICSRGSLRPGLTQSAARLECHGTSHFYCLEPFS